MDKDVMIATHYSVACISFDIRIETSILTPDYALYLLKMWLVAQCGNGTNHFDSLSRLFHNFRLQHMLQRLFALLLEYGVHFYSISKSYGLFQDICSQSNAFCSILLYTLHYQRFPCVPLTSANIQIPIKCTMSTTKDNTSSTICKWFINLPQIKFNEMNRLTKWIFRRSWNFFYDNYYNNANSIDFFHLDYYIICHHR